MENQMWPSLTLQWPLECVLIKGSSEVRRWEGAWRSSAVEIEPSDPSLSVGQHDPRGAGVPIDVLLSPVSEEFNIFCLVIWIISCFRNKIRQFFSLGVVEVDVLRHGEVGKEAGEAVLGRADGDDGEVQLWDGESLDGGGHWIVGPAGKGLVDQECRSRKSSKDDKDPEDPRNSSASGDVGEAMDGGGFQKLLDGSLHRSGLEHNEHWRPLIVLCIVDS